MRPPAPAPTPPHPAPPPPQIIEKVLELCNSQQLGMLSTSCSYFTRSGVIDKFAQQKLKEVSRAKGMRPHTT
jgi:E3 ubiquitin-protein ligase HERC3